MSRQRRSTAEVLMAKRRRAERKAGIERKKAKPVPFSTKLAREGFPHGKTAASLRSVGLDR